VSLVASESILSDVIGFANALGNLVGFRDVCVALMVRPSQFEPSWEMCVGQLVRASQFVCLWQARALPEKNMTQTPSQENTPDR
jgi:hypothetical protein